MLDKWTVTREVVVKWTLSSDVQTLVASSRLIDHWSMVREVMFNQPWRIRCKASCDAGEAHVVDSNRRIIVEHHQRFVTDRLTLTQRY